MRFVRDFLYFLEHVFENKGLLLTLVKNDFRREYLGSYLGLTWAFVQPLVMVSVFWFVFEVGFRVAPPVDDVPFVLWLICGMFPWFFFSNSVGSGVNAIRQNAFLVRKVAFRVSILPIVTIGSQLLVHFVFVIFLIIIFMIYGYMPTMYWLQLPYYIFCTIFLVLGLSWLTSSLCVFIQDVGNLVNVLLQIGFWMTPIFWSTELVPESYMKYLELNPMYYVVNGYRDSLINGVWFWEHAGLTVWFFLFSSILFVVGAIVFKRLRPHFGDVL